MLLLFLFHPFTGMAREGIREVLAMLMLTLRSSFSSLGNVGRVDGKRGNWDRRKSSMASQYARRVLFLLLPLADRKRVV